MVIKFCIPVNIVQFHLKDRGSSYKNVGIKSFLLQVEAKGQKTAILFQHGSNIQQTFLV